MMRENCHKHTEYYFLLVWLRKIVYSMFYVKALQKYFTLFHIIKYAMLSSNVFHAYVRKGTVKNWIVMSHLMFSKSFLFLSSSSSSSLPPPPPPSFYFRVLFSLFDDNVECWKHSLVCHEHKFIYIVYRPNQEWMVKA